MFIYIFQMQWRGAADFTCFVRGYERRRKGRRLPLQPQVELAHAVHSLTAYEVGQLLGGN